MTTKNIQLMGIINVTPDSFSGDGIMDSTAVYNHIERIIKNGADIVDIGGESTKPGANPLSHEQEQRRILPIIQKVFEKTSIPISVDTYHPETAEKVLKLGVKIINDITGLTNHDMCTLVAHHQAEVVIMHMRGIPETMQKDPHCKDIILEIKSFFRERITKANAAGIPDKNIIVDPGIGFGKLLEHNLAIFKNLNEFKRPFDDKRVYRVLVGPSRKSFIGKLTGKENPQDRLMGTAASVAIAIANGADIIRVHDVVEMRDVIAVAQALS